MKITFEDNGRVISEFTVGNESARKILDGEMALLEVGNFDPNVGFCHASLKTVGKPPAQDALKAVRQLQAIVDEVNGAKPSKKFSPLFTGVKVSPEVSKPRNLLEYAEERLDFVTLTADPDPFRYVFKVISDYLERKAA